MLISLHSKPDHFDDVGDLTQVCVSHTDSTSVTTDTRLAQGLGQEELLQLGDLMLLLLLC